MSALVTLSNDGLIPMEAVTTMGISAKEGENPIGFFGTGLKYAVASLLRTGHRITIYRGLDRYDFAVEKGEVRGKEFDFITMAGPEGQQRLGFTTHLGARWEMWQVFRELYSNCLDEGGSMAFAAVDPAEGRTTIHVRGEGFASAARDRATYFLTTQPLYTGALVAVHPGRSAGVYYRGVLVSPIKRPAAHTYNIITDIELTEDRTLKNMWYADSYISHALANCTDPKVIEAAVRNADGYEATLAFGDPGETFAETVLEVSERLGIAAVAGSAVKSAEGWAQREARVKEAPLSRRERDEIEQAKAFLRTIGYPITSPVTVAETLGADVFGMAKDGRIFIARVTLNRGGNFLVGTLLEEQLHITHGFLDESRRFQDFLIDLVVKFAKDAAFDSTCSVAPEASPPASRTAPALALADMEIPF